MSGNFFVTNVAHLQKKKMFIFYVSKEIEIYWKNNKKINILFLLVFKLKYNKINVFYVIKKNHSLLSFIRLTKNFKINKLQYKLTVDDRTLLPQKLSITNKTIDFPAA